MYRAEPPDSPPFSPSPAHVHIAESNRACRSMSASDMIQRPRRSIDMPLLQWGNPVGRPRLVTSITYANTPTRYQQCSTRHKPPHALPTRTSSLGSVAKLAKLGSRGRAEQTIEQLRCECIVAASGRAGVSCGHRREITGDLGEIYLLGSWVEKPRPFCLPSQASPAKFSHEQESTMLYGVGDLHCIIYMSSTH